MKRGVEFLNSRSARKTSPERPRTGQSSNSPRSFSQRRMREQKTFPRAHLWEWNEKKSPKKPANNSSMSMKERRTMRVGTNNLKRHRLPPVSLQGQIMGAQQPIVGRLRVLKPESTSNPSDTFLTGANSPENSPGGRYLGDQEGFVAGTYLTTPSPTPWEGCTDSDLNTTTESYFASNAREHFFDTYQRTHEEQRGVSSPRAEYLRECITAKMSPLPLLNFGDHRQGKDDGDSEDKAEMSTREVLDFSNKLMGAERAKTLLAFLVDPPFQYRSLRLANNALGNYSASRIVLTLADNLSRITDLNLADNGLGFQICNTLSDALTGKMLDLVSLDLSDNRLGHRGLQVFLEAIVSNKTLQFLKLRNVGIEKEGHVLEKILHENDRLTSLDLSWNNLFFQQAERVVKGIAENWKLKNLDLAHNNFGGDGVAEALSMALTMNEMLERIDLSFNKISERAACMLADSARATKTLKWINLEGNPLGPFGCREFVKFHAARADDGPRVYLNGCNFVVRWSQTAAQTKKVAVKKVADTKDGTPVAEPLPKVICYSKDKELVFDELDPNGLYSLHLDQPYDRYVARTLATLAIRDGGECFLDEMMDGKPWNLNEDAHIEDLEDLMPREGVLTLKFRSESTGMLPVMTREKSTQIQDAFLMNTLEPACYPMNAPKPSNNEMVTSETNSVMRQCILTALTQYFAFEAAHAKALIATFGMDSAARVKAATELFCCCPEDAFEMITVLSPIEKMQVQHQLGPFFSFNPKNMTGHYELNLGVKYDRAMAVHVFQVNTKERLERMGSGKLDLSQKKNFECIRNEEYEGVPFAYQSGWLIPEHGIIKFDYVSSRRPPSDAVVFDEKDFATFLSQYVTMDRGLPTQPLSKEVIQNARNAFERHDADGSGAVDYEEIVLILSEMGFKVDDDTQPKAEGRRASSAERRKSLAGAPPMTLPKKKIIELITSLDADKSGVLEWSEFLLLWQTINSWKNTSDLHDMFDQFDKDKGGSIDVHEIRAILNSLGMVPSDENLNQMIDKADGDGTGVIEFDEFLHLWEDVVYQFKWSNRVVELRRRSTESYFTCEQVRSILDQIEDDYQRVQAFLIFYERVVDEENFFIAMDPLADDQRDQLRNMLGPLSLFNPLVPDGHYNLDLSLNDCWLCARVLTDLADVEPGENWFGEQMNGVDFEFSDLWIAETPDKGILSLRYGCAKGNEDMKFRKEQCETILGWEFDDDYDEAEMLQKARNNARNEKAKAKVIEDMLAAAAKAEYEAKRAGR